MIFYNLIKFVGYTVLCNIVCRLHSIMQYNCGLYNIM